MNVIGVNHPYLLRLANDPAFNWMTSIEPLRHLKPSTKKCCGQAGYTPTPMQTFQTVSDNKNFVIELKTLKAVLKADKLIVSVIGHRAQY